MPGLLSSRPHWVPPPPQPQESVAPPPLGPRGETLSLAGEGVGGPNSDDGTATPVLYVHYKCNPFSINRHEYIYV